MKQLLVFLALLSFNCSVAQNQTSNYHEKRDIAKNELSIGVFNLVVFGALDVAYERILDGNSSLGIEIFGQIIDPDNNETGDAFYKDISITGKYKHFFGSSYARGFYVNGFGMLSSGNYDPAYNNYNEDNFGAETENYTDFALGFGVGGKFVSPKGFFLDLSAGIGRNFFSSNSPTIVGQFNVNLGFRF